MDKPLTRKQAEAKQYGQGLCAGKYSPDQCAEEVCSNDRASLFYQCTRKPGHGPEKLYCKKHAVQFAEATETWWRVTLGDIEPHEIVKATASRVTLVGGPTEEKRSSYQNWFPTKEAAEQFLLRQLRHEVTSLKAQLAAAEEQLVQLMKACGDG